MTEPGPDRVHNAIGSSVTGPVVQAGSVSGGITVTVPALPAHIVPHQLPAVASPFVGRAEEVARLTDSLEHAGDGGSLIHVISATAGAGKTTLAVRWAHQVSARFPDGQLYVNLRGFDPSGAPVTPAEAIRGFLDAFGVRPEQIPVALDAQAALYRSLLAERRVLVVLDNARDAEQVRPLLPGPRCFVVVTSRHSLDSLIVREGARSIRLDPLSHTEATELVAARVGAGRAETSPAAVRELVDRCVRLPLALVLAAARAIADPALPLDALAEELRDEQDRLDALDLGDTYLGMRAVFSWSYQALSPPAADLFRLLGLHQGPTIGLHAAAALADVPVRRARVLLAELTQAHLVEESGKRYALHDLLRSYAAELVGGSVPDGAVRRLLDHYLHTALAADRRLAPHRAKITVPPATSPPVEVTDETRALDWFTTEHANLLAAVATAEQHGEHTRVWPLAWSAVTYFERKGHWRDWLATQTAAVTAATRTGDRSAEARAHRLASRAAIRLHRYDDAAAHLERALGLYEDLNIPVGKARTHIAFSWVRELQERYTEAVDHAIYALKLFREVGSRTGEARALDQLGWELALAGDCEQGLVHCEHALDLFRALDHRAGQADTEDSLGYINHQLGRYDRAESHLRRSIALCRSLGDQHTEAVAHDRLGDTLFASGRRTKARQSWTTALVLFEQEAAPEAAAVRAKLTDLR
ncbi:tetratricopeptide repeat protein [Saccharothrix variisporea]|uniref:Putative ATPase n=1 Tax=Saccharothrix variisporea TaxID=543527 RepID=A0A495X538_9PSEU|nr:tetratricopeptide repeat protein [Saccharothrix variisporea]RKT67733.1 putative ATPase [Saccharothrix variisporea]